MRLSSFQPQQVLITRLSAIGDCVLTIPLAVAVKKLWPQCTLHWVVECGVDELLSTHPAIDQVIRIEKGWLGRPMEWGQVRRQLRGLGCDLALDPQGLSKSSLLAWLSGAKYRVGFDSSHAREVAPLLYSHRIRRQHRHMVDTYLELLKPWATLEPGAGEFAMPCYSDAALRARKIAQDLDLPASWIALNPGAGWTTRLWPVQRFGQLSRELFREKGLRSLVFWAGEQEQLMAKVIEEESRGAAQVAPATSLSEMLELLRLSTLLVTGDTGPLHLASSVGTPCVSLHGPTWSDESGPYGNANLALQSPIVSSSQKLVRKGPNIAMQAIEVDDVFRACASLLRELSQGSLTQRLAG